MDVKQSDTSMLFGSRTTFGIECEITDETKSYFFGKIRIWIGGGHYGDYSGEIISTYVFEFEHIIQYVANGKVDCSGRLPYMERLHWQIEPDKSGHRVLAQVEGDEPIEVFLPGTEFVDTCSAFVSWVRSHPTFGA